MATRHVGSNRGHDLVLQPDYPEATRDEFGAWKLTYLYACLSARAHTLAPAHGASPPAPEASIYTGLHCSGIRLYPHPNKGHVFLEATYSVYNASILIGGQRYRSVGAAVVEKPIGEHPSLTDDQKIAKVAKGRKTYLQGSVTYRVRQIYATYAWNESAIIAGVGHLGAPDGLGGATSTKWLKIGLNIQESQGGTEVEDVWMYDEHGWDSDIYS